MEPSITDVRRRGEHVPLRAHTHDRGLELIAAFKLTKAVLMIAIGLGALRLLDPATAVRVRDWVTRLALHSGQRIVVRVLALLSGLSPRRIELLSAAAIAYGLLFAVEGIGLWRGRRWAEWLTVIATASLVPLEGYEMARRFTLPRLLALLTNLAAVAYLAYRLRRPSPRQAPTVDPPRDGARRASSRGPG